MYVHTSICIYYIYIYTSAWSSAHSTDKFEYIYIKTCRINLNTYVLKHVG